MVGEGGEVCLERAGVALKPLPVAGGEQVLEGLYNINHKLINVGYLMKFM